MMSVSELRVREKMATNALILYSIFQSSIIYAFAGETYIK